ncbi:hypothetical protein ACHQM5_030300 [Ranunculus cassubicifolius]
MSKSLRVQKKTNKKISHSSKRKNVGLVKKVVDYLLSDSYMYAPMVSAPKTTKSPSTGPLGYLKRAISAKNKPKKHVQIREEQPEKTSDLHVKDGVIYGVGKEGVDELQRSPLGRHETVKHMVHYSTRVSGSPDRGTVKELFSEFKKKPVFNEFLTRRSK